MKKELENEFFEHFNVTDREKELIENYKKLESNTYQNPLLPLFLCSIKDYDGVKKYVANGFDINTYYGGDSLLSIVISDNDAEMFSYLLNNKFEINSNSLYLKYLLLSINKKFYDGFDFLIQYFKNFPLSEDDIKTVIKKSFSNIYLISKVIELDIHLNANGNTLINDTVDFGVKTDVLEYLLNSKLIDTEKCNQMYAKTANNYIFDQTIDRLKLLSPYCNKINNIPYEFKGERYFEIVKFILLDKKYSNYDWIDKFFDNYGWDKFDKTEILKFILDNDIDSEILYSIMFTVIVQHHNFDLDVILEFIDRMDADHLNKTNDDVTAIHQILTDPYGNTAKILERAISNGYDVDIPYIHTDWDSDDNEITTTETTLEFLINRISFSKFNEETSKELTYLLVNHCTLTKETIDKLISYFNEIMRLYNDFETNFLEYLNSVYENHTDCPSFFAENYEKEIIENEYLNLLPQTAKDVFVF